MENIWENEILLRMLIQNGVVVMPTDTLYGFVGKAENESVVKRIYTIRKRNPNKPFIVLIGDLQELEKFSISLSEEQKNKLNEYWPGPVSVILDCEDQTLSYLHRGTNTLAFRLPKPQGLRDLLLKTGPLIAPSANSEGLKPAEDITQAKEYFGNDVDLYIDGGTLAGKASKLIKLHKDGTINILRV